MPEKTTVVLTTHPTPEVLAAFGRGELLADDLATVAEHVRVCDTCCATLGRIPDDSLVGLARQAAAVRTPSDPVSIPPALLPLADGVPPALADHPRYRILGELGAGGMGVVYKAQHKIMDRVVALKVLAPHLTARPSAKDRFIKEVKAAAKLSHANIVTAYDAEEAGGLHFLVMEFVEGVSLERLVSRRGPLPVPMACQFARQVAYGLRAAHEKGLVHRDIKPSNLMVTRKGEVKILDFGLAKFARDQETEGDPTARKPAATAANMLMGTPDYLSPEQARSSREVDIRSDLYSLGCTLYFLLTGQAPFAAATTVIDKLLAHTEEAAPPVKTMRPEVPDGLADVVARLMAKMPEERYQTPAEVAAALTPFCKPGEAVANPGPAPVLIPVVDAVVVPPPPPNPFALTQLAADTEPEREPNGPTLAEVARPRKSRKKKRAASGRAWKWGVIAGIAAFALLAGLVVRKVVKQITTPTETVEKNDRPDKPTGGIGGTVPPPPGGKPGGTPPAPSVVPGGNPPQVLFVLPTKEVWLPDYLPVRKVLEKDNRARVVTASGVIGPVLPHQDTPGDPVPIDVVLRKTTDMRPYAAIAFCGKGTMDYFPNPMAPNAKEPPHSTAVKAVLENMTNAGKPIGAICFGQPVLAGHGLLKGKRVAFHKPTEDILRAGGPALNAGIDSSKFGVAVDGKLVTASGPENAVEFAEKLLEVLYAK